MLWPAFHYRLDFNYQREAEGYQRVNALIARSARRRMIFSIHDYHRCRWRQTPSARCCTHRFFPAYPFPTPEIFTALPPHAELLEQMADYDCWARPRLRVS
ncbi:trehalose-6-phosphate synthase [Yokenella regensburgei]|uniref:trehalose-6-phosphate synthase n=1 Tax=Yokenella regensburgei TaxID=158877 RepID=UPI003CC91447